MVSEIDWKHAPLKLSLFIFVWYIYENLFIINMIENQGIINLEQNKSQNILLSILVFILRCRILLLWPRILFDFAGLLFFPFPTGPISLKKSIDRSTPFICFRVVTRGLYRKLLIDTTTQNINLCINAGLNNFIFEIVTDDQLFDFPDLSNRIDKKYVREICVPRDYKTPKGTRFKARALNYCLGYKKTNLKDNDYIVHLDEETRLTPDVINGLVNFCTDGRYQIGQGVITYCDEDPINGPPVRNWFTTLIDTERVAVDIAGNRFTLGWLHRALYQLHGSFLVASVGAERLITFDFGPDGGSMAEDSYFALEATRLGFRADFVEGDMREMSPFTISDQLLQRKRWILGCWYAVMDPSIKLKDKLFFVLGITQLLTLPLEVLNIALSGYYSFAYYGLVGRILECFHRFAYIFGLFFMVSGALKQFGGRYKKEPLKLMLLLCLSVVFLSIIVIMMILTVIRCAYAMLIRHVSFEIVKKE